MEARSARALRYTLAVLEDRTGDHLCCIENPQLVPSAVYIHDAVRILLGGNMSGLPPPKRTALSRHVECRQRLLFWGLKFTIFGFKGLLELSAAQNEPDSAATNSFAPVSLPISLFGNRALLNRSCANCAR